MFSLKQVNYTYKMNSFVDKLCFLAQNSEYITITWSRKKSMFCIKLQDSSNKANINLHNFSKRT